VSWTKRDVIGQAFSEIGLASYTFDLLPEQYEGALRCLDAMIAQWENKGSASHGHCQSVLRTVQLMM
jgi:hypothetical protein